MNECLTLSRVLHAEYNHLHPKTPLPDDIKDDLKKVTEALGKKERAALCISGGGIRSASFALGVIQGLAKLGKDAASSFLSQIDYLSTVSGGGYIGAWLSAWAKSEGKIETVIEQMRKRPEDKQKPEPKEVRHLREYSNYLTPRLGLFSADTWAFFGAYLRNLILMWLVLVPLFLGVLALPRVFVTLAVNDLRIPADAFKYASVALFFWAIAFTGLTRPTRTPAPKKWFYSNGGFQFFCLLPLCLFSATLVLAHAQFPLDKWENGLLKMIGLAVTGTVLSSLIYTIRKIRDEGGQVLKKQLVELLVAAVSGVLFAVLVYLFLTQFPAKHTMLQPNLMGWVQGQAPLLSDSVAAAYIVFGVPLVILALVLQAAVFVGGTGKFNDDFDREWWGRAAAWVIIAGLGWIVITAVAIYGPVGLYYAPRTLAAIGGVSGLFAILAGRSSSTGANEKEQEKGGTTGTVANALLGLATPVFVLILLAGLSLGTTLLLRKCFEYREIIKPRPNQEANIGFLKRMSWKYEQPVDPTKVVPPEVAKLAPEPGKQTIESIPHPGIEGDKLAGLDHLYLVEKTPLGTSAALFLGAILIAIGASSLIGVNRFSMHALYRDRIVRGYLAASNKKREPNPFTGFDPNDNIAINDLLNRPMHVVNICLNLTSGGDLAWQERKAESFTATPLHCGSLNLGYRPSSEYGGPNGMRLGTAVGISGAAASPNMGYHSSPALALLLTFFNVRLGWWLGNPTDEVASKLDNPKASLKPLLAETFGMSDKDHPYVYLSDGGHFENLGLYEMVLRRCRYIVISDGGSDNDFVFEDLGNAIRKIYIDFGIRVRIDKMELYPRTTADEHEKSRKYCATGKIFYSDVDGEDAPEGHFVYIKPVFYKTDVAQDIYNYGMMNDTFPHQTTGDQFFSESQLESYRALGEYTVNQICEIDQKDEAKARQRRGAINTVAEFVTEVEKYTDRATP